MAQTVNKRQSVQGVRCLWLEVRINRLIPQWAAQQGKPLKFLNHPWHPRVELVWIEPIWKLFLEPPWYGAVDGNFLPSFANVAHVRPDTLVRDCRDKAVRWIPDNYHLLVVSTLHKPAGTGFDRLELLRSEEGTRKAVALGVALNWGTWD